MKTRIALSALALAVLAGCGGGGPEGPAAPSTNETTRVIAFGDSLTDGGAYSRGNSLLLQAPPPQGGGIPAALANQVGKFTNSPGDNWVEVLAKKLGTTIAPERFEMGSASPVAASNGANPAPNATNYAQGGSRVALEPGVGCYLPAPAPQTGPCSAQAAVPVKTQIDRAVAKGRFDAKDLVIVWAGANDVFYNATLAGNDITAATIAAGRPLTTAETQAIVGKYVIAMETAALNALEQTRRVMANGAQRVVLMTIPNAGQTPFGAQGGASRIGLLTALAGAYNAQVKKELDLSNPGGVLLFDAGALSSAWYTNPTANGFVNKDLPVCGIGSFAALPGSSSSFCFITAGPAGTQFNPFASVLPAGVTPENSMFADGVHPSLTAHGKFGNAVYDALKAKAWVK